MTVRHVHIQLCGQPRQPDFYNPDFYNPEDDRTWHTLITH